MTSRSVLCVAVGISLLTLPDLLNGQGEEDIPAAPQQSVWLDDSGNVLSRKDRNRILRSRGKLRYACGISTQPDPKLDTTNAAAWEEARRDIDMVDEALRNAIGKSPDMRKKILEACRRNGNRTGLKNPPPPDISIVIHRDNPQVDYATAYPADGTMSGRIWIDLGDIEQVRNYFKKGSDRELVDIVSKSALTRALAHEFDHLRDPPNRWKERHGDPLGNRRLQGRPVMDANKVKEETGSGDVRLAYGAAEIRFTGGRRMPMKTAVLRFGDLLNRNRRVFSGGGSGFGTPETIGSLPDHPCRGEGDTDCYPPPDENDGDLDGVVNGQDNCPDHVNPWQLDENGDGVGDDCQPLRVDLSQPPVLLVELPGTDSASRDPFTQLMFTHIPAFEVPPAVATRMAMTEGAHVPGGSVISQPSDGLQVIVRSLGALGGEALEMHILNGTGEVIRIQEGGLMLEPLDLEGPSLERFEAELEKLRERNPTSVRLDAYCVEFLQELPGHGIAFRIAPMETQFEFEPVEQIVRAGRATREKGLLSPDSDPTEYYHSIQQWAVWSSLEGLDADSFGKEFLEQTRKIFDEAGQPWTEESEVLVRELIPNRWNDVAQILEEANRTTQ